MQNAFGQFVPAFVGILVAVLAILGGANPWLIAAALVFCFTMVPFAFIESKPLDRQRLLGWIDRRDNLFAYDALVGTIDHTVTRMLAPRKIEDEPQRAGRLARLKRWTTPRARDAIEIDRLSQRPFAWPVMDAALKVAVIYPLLLLLLQWAITNQPTGIGDITPLFPAHWSLRLLATCPLLLLFSVKIAQFADWKVEFAGLSGQQILDSLFFFTNALVGAGVIAVTLLVSFQPASTVTLTSAVTVAVAGTLASTVALASAIAGALVSAAASAGAMAMALAGPIALGLAFASPLVLAGPFAVATAVARDRAALGYAGLFLACLAAVTVSISLGAGHTPPEGLILAFAIGVLPLVNAVFDYFSYGVPLSLLRAGRRDGGWPPLVCGILDAIAAVLILYGLALTLCLILAAINALGAVPLLPLDPLFDDLADPAIRGGYAWLYLTLLSTLVPTGVHLVLALISVTTLLPQAAKRWFIDRITDETSDLATLTGVAGFALFIAVSLVGLVWIAWHGALWIMAHFDDSALLLLSAVESTVRWLGIV